MKKLIIPFFLLVSAQIGFAQSIDQLEWLVGKWQRANTRPGSQAFESWQKSNEALIGIGVTLKGTDTVFVEKLKIVLKDGALNYVADVAQNGKPIFFKITSMNEKGFVSENPTHDFPKKIEYRLENDQLTATISGDGKAIPFVFQKKE